MARSPSPAIEADDFDPRGGESNNDFGDFRSAPTIAATTKTAQPQTSSDFADFQSAFGDTTPASTASNHTPSLVDDPISSPMPQQQTGSNAQQSDDLLGLSFDVGGVGASQSSGFTSLNASTPSAFLPNLGGQVGAFPTSAGAIRQPVSLPGAFPPMPNNHTQTPSPVVQFPGGGSIGFPQQTPFVQAAVPSTQFQQQPMSMTSLTSNNADAMDLFGSSSSVPAAPVLQPATKASNGAIPSSNSASNNINNNSNNPSLQVSNNIFIIMKGLQIFTTLPGFHSTH